MPVIRETAEAYHARDAASASLLADMLPPEGCMALAHARSRWLNPHAQPKEPTSELLVGTAAHLAILEPEQLGKRTTVIEAPDYRSMVARACRDDALAQGLVPLLAAEYELVRAMRQAIEQSEDAAPLLLGEDGENELSFTWDADGFAEDAIPCKARLDRVIRHRRVIVDLKTAASASEAAFQRAVIRDNHALRAAWYIDGWEAAAPENEYCDYRFVIVAKEPPHLISVWWLEETAIEHGRRAYERALARLAIAVESNSWPGFAKPGGQAVRLPIWYENQLINAEAIE